ncbi:TetR/AcrR family transcriptional regulator [Streptomyces sp. NPDC021093]|uniref:TetR/AcrR family transcriptional regulator n=1 Tax=Streptomyces sp. NPDC021093 TaxID=3365112 RepID=UPI00379A3CA4
MALNAPAPVPAPVPAAVTDGRRAKGERRRRAIIEATLRVVERDGAAGVSHRTVAREAGLPTTASTYYFQSLDDLLTAALTSVMNEDAARMRQLIAETDAGADSLHTMAGLMAEVVATPGHLLAEYELFLLAARRPELREATDRWLDALADFARRFTDDPVRIRTVTAVVDGLLLQALLTDQPPSAAEFEAVLRSLLLAPSGTGGPAIAKGGNEIGS